MKLDTQLYADDVEASLVWIGSVMGRALDKRVQNWENEEKDNPLLRQYYREEYQVEFDLVSARQHKRKTGRVSKDKKYNIAYSFAAAMQKLSAALPEAEKPRLNNRLNGALNDPFGLRPLAYEASTAIHLSANGCELDWADAAGIGNFDFLAQKNGVQFEMECKTTSADTGRKVHRLGLYRVAGCAISELDKLVKHGGSHLFCLKVPQRLDRKEGQVAVLGGMLSESVRSRQSMSSNTGVVEYFELPAFSDDFLTSEAEIRSSLDPLVGKSNYPFLFVRMDKSVVFVTATSELNDAVAAAILSKVKEATRQFTGTRPAVIAVQLVDMTRETLETLLRTPNALHAITRQAFRKSHVSCVAYSVRPTSWMTSGEASTQGQWPVLTWNNPDTSFRSPEIENLFP